MLETCSVFKGNLLLFTDSFGKAIVKMRSISCCFLNLWSFLFHSQFSTTLNSMKFILTLLFFMGFELSLCMYFSKTCNPGQNILNKLKKQRGIGHDDHYYFWKGHFPVLSNILRYLFCISRSRSSCPELSCKKGVPKDFEKFTGKHLCQSLFFNKIAGLRPAMLLKKRLWLRCFPVNFAKFLRTPYLQNISGGCICLPATPRGIHIECSLYQILNSQTFLKCYKVRKYYVQNCLRIFLLLSTL